MFGFYKAYVGIGNNDAPPEILQKMSLLSATLAAKGWTLRHTGDKDGAAVAFEQGAGGQAEAYIAWKGFNDRQSEFIPPRNVHPEVITLMKQYIPTFDNIKPGAHKVISRAVYAIIGKDLRSPAQFVVCWSADGAESAGEKTAKTGFMGMPIALASNLKMPVFNLQKPDAMERLNRFLETH